MSDPVFAQKPPLQIVKMITPTVTIENDLFGGVAIKIDDFVYVQVNYDHRYTCNASRRDLVNHIIEYLTGVKTDDPTVKKVEPSAADDNRDPGDEAA